MINWKPIPNLTGYEVSDCGKVRSIDREVVRCDTGKSVFIKGCIQKPQIDKYGYVRVRLSVQNKKSTHKVHRLVALTFIPNPDNLPQVNHKDGNKQHNSIQNLEWINNQNNQIHANKTGLRISPTKENHPMFTGKVVAYDLDGNIVAEMFGNLDMKAKGFDYRLVSACLLGKRKTHKNCYFRKVKNEN